jgi:hypothetical protein
LLKKDCASLRTPDALLHVWGGDDHGLVMGLRGVEIQCGRGLRAQVAILYVEVGGANAEFATDTGELKASFDPLCRVVSHSIIVVGDREWCSHEGGAAKVTREASEAASCGRGGG